MADPLFPYVKQPEDKPAGPAPVATAGSGEHRHGRHAIGKVADRIVKYSNYTPEEALGKARAAAEEVL